jgi:hypothetical protein
VRKSVSFINSLLVLVALACGIQFSTASISDATLAKDADGNQPVSTFNQDDTFHLVVELANAPGDTSVKAVWTVVEADGVDPNFSLGEKEITGDGAAYFTLSNDQLWPVGEYKVDLYLNGELDRTLEFQVEGDVLAQEPTETPEPIATPEPTETPEPTATPEPEPSQPPEGSAGDSLGDALGTDRTEATEPLPFKDEPYVHPSGAFTFALPESFEGITGGPSNVAFGNDQSVVGVIFTDAQVVYTEKQMQGFTDDFTEGFMSELADKYEVLEQTVQPDDSIYVALAYEASNGDGDADFFFEQRETVVFVLYFVTTAYEEMQPTWDEIIASYSVDAQAALAAAPTTPPPTTAPPPPPGPSVPAGKGMLIFNNRTGVDFVIDVIGPTNSSEVIPPNSTKEFILDPGNYTINGHSPGGDYVIDAYTFDIAAGQAFPLNLN